MTESIADMLLNRAWREFLDPGSPSSDLDAAAIILGRGHPWVMNRVYEAGGSDVLELAPDRLTRLARILPRGGILSAPPMFASAIVDAFIVAHRAHDANQTLLPLRRAHALVEMVARFGTIAAELPAAGVAWLYANDEYALPDLLLPLRQWCIAHDPIPEAVVDVVCELRLDEQSSSTLDRLVAWVAPSAQGMLDLAGWENGFRLHWPEWREAAAGWERGEHDPAVDARVLRDTIDLKSSANTRALQTALQRHGATTRSALHEAHDRSSQTPIIQTILAAWITAVAGAA